MGERKWRTGRGRRERENGKGGRDVEGKEEGKKLNESHYVFHSPASEFTTCRASERGGEVLSAGHAPACINNAGVWQCRRCTSIMAPNTASALSLSQWTFYLYFIKTNTTHTQFRWYLTGFIEEPYTVLQKAVLENVFEWEHEGLY